jgi:hypothetical protein
MFGRSICVSRLVFFANMIYLFNTPQTCYICLITPNIWFFVFRNILILLFVTWQLLNTIERFELFPSAGTVGVFQFVMLDSG